MQNVAERLAQIETFIRTRTQPFLERTMSGSYLERIDRLELEVRDRIQRFETARYLDRIERLEQLIDRQADLVEGLLDVLIATHPDSVALFQVLHADAKARLRILQGGRPSG